MDIFYGAAIQGAKNRGEFAYVHRTLIDQIKAAHRVLSEHTTGKTKEESAALMEQAIGPLPLPGIERTIYVRRKMIQLIDARETRAAVFELSIPSTGTGIEIAHAYLRPERGLPEIPILGLYQQGYWPNGLTTMVRGITQEELPNMHVKEYATLDDAVSALAAFLTALKS